MTMSEKSIGDELVDRLRRFTDQLNESAETMIVRECP